MMHDESEEPVILFNLQEKNKYFINHRSAWATLLNFNHITIGKKWVWLRKAETNVILVSFKPPEEGPGYDCETCNTYLSNTTCDLRTFGPTDTHTHTHTHTEHAHVYNKVSFFMTYLNILLDEADTEHGNAFLLETVTTPILGRHTP
jgi:hypothetical protein